MPTPPPHRNSSPQATQKMLYGQQAYQSIQTLNAQFTARLHRKGIEQLRLRLQRVREGWARGLVRIWHANSERGWREEKVLLLQRREGELEALTQAPHRGEDSRVVRIVCAGRSTKARRRRVMRRKLTSSRRRTLTQSPRPDWQLCKRNSMRPHTCQK